METMDEHGGRLIGRNLTRQELVRSCISHRFDRRSTTKLDSRRKTESTRAHSHPAEEGYTVSPRTGTATTRPPCSGQADAPEPDAPEPDEPAAGEPEPGEPAAGKPKADQVGVGETGPSVRDGTGKSESGPDKAGEPG